MKNLLITLAIATLLATTTPSVSHAQDLVFSLSGQVGTNGSATNPTTTNGIIFGNTQWLLNGTALDAGTEILFQYRIGSDVLDTGTSADNGQFIGGTFSVSIPSSGINDVATSEIYDLNFLDLDSRDILRIDPRDESGLVIDGQYFPGVAAFADANVLAPLASTNVGSVLGFSAGLSGDATLSLSNGDVLSTQFTELLVNPAVSSTTAVPEPSSFCIVALSGLLIASRRRR